MTRVRSTWSEGSPRQAATHTADLYTMNQEHPQPSPVEYENGDPDSWAETPASNKSIEMDYEGDHVKRNELGFAEMRDDTFKHKDSDVWGGPGKYDNERLASTQRKAQAVERVSRALLRTADEKLVEDQALDLMALPDQVLVATLRRLDRVSPDSLTKDQKFRRALACCKLAQNILPDGASEPDVERLASVLMSIDDPTLKDILKIASSVKVAKEGEEDDKPEEQTAAPKKDEVQEQVQVQAKQDQDNPDQGQLSAADKAALDAMINEEMSACGQPAPAPAPAPELTDLFAPQPVMTSPVPASPIAPMASEAADISFSDDGEGETQVAGDTSDLDDLFSDNPEVQAQREIQAAEAAAGGFGPAPATRTASAGAKKIGQVSKPAKGSQDDELASLWDRPQA